MPAGAVTMAIGSEISVRVTVDHRLAEEWELVLLSQGLSPTVRRTREGTVLSVPEEEVESALAGLAAYENENPPKHQEEYDRVGSASFLEGAVVAGILLVFFSVTVVWNATVPWFERGCADADRILLGELWRPVTALTLHADLVHALINAIAAAVFLGAVFGMLGLGVGSALVLLAGAGGNLANALLHVSPHISVGASTSLFGAIGILGGLAMNRRRRAVRGRRGWVPLAAALALLAMLGTEGQRVDIWAHFFGLLVGGVLGILIALVAPRPPAVGIQWTSGCATLGALIYSWIVAVR